MRRIFCLFVFLVLFSTALEFVSWSIRVNFGRPAVLTTKIYRVNGSSWYQTEYLAEISKKSWPNPFGAERLWRFTRNNDSDGSMIGVREDVLYIPYHPKKMTAGEWCKLTHTEITCIINPPDYKDLSCTTGDGPPWDRIPGKAYLRDKMRKEFEVKKLIPSYFFNYSN